MSNTLGIFGKIPAHGDFIERNLQRSFTTLWDDWLQRCLASSREQIGDSWLDYYLTSPIWRFVLSVGAVDSQAWAGILVPSVDSVGRYFPLTIVAKIPLATNSYEFLCVNDNWYNAIEEAALACLQEGIDTDTMIERLHSSLEFVDCSDNTSQMPLSNGHLVLPKEPSLEAAYSQLLQQSMSSKMESPTLWWSKGSQYAPSNLLNTQGLPSSHQYAAFINGNWNNQ